MGKQNETFDEKDTCNHANTYLTINHGNIHDSDLGITCASCENF